MFVNFNILNQLGSPAINSNTFANRPAAGQTGRLFVSTDTFEIYRDNGTTWDLIGGPGSSTITGSGTATQVAYFTSSQAIGSSANLFWDNTNTRLGVGTATPGYTIEANGSIKADRVYLTGATAGNGALYWTSDRVTVANYNVGGVVHIETNGGSAAAIFGSDLTGTFASGIGTRGYTGSTSYGALLNGSVGINTATPGAALDIHGTGVIQQINSTSATANSLLAFQRSGVGVWRIGDNYNGGSNYFELYNTVLATTGLQLDGATNKAVWQSQQTYSTGLARANYFDYNLSVAAGGSFSSPNAITALGATLDLTLAGSATIPSGARSGLDAYNTVSFTGTGTLTQGQGSQIRAYSNLTTGWAFAGSSTGTITHLAGLRVLFPDNSGSAVTITNNYGLLINDQTANTGTVTYTNRWGIYQEGASDLNYLNANLLLGSTTNSGDKLQVNGTAKITGAVTVEGSNITIQPSTATTYALFVAQNTGGFLRFGRDTSTGALYGDPYAALLISSGAYPMLFGTNDTERMRLTSGGNLGLGVTPAAWRNTDKVFQNNNSVFYNESNTNTWLGHNFYEDSGGNYRYINTDFATTIRQVNGQWIFYNAPSGTAGNSFSFTERFRINESGLVGINTNNPINPLSVNISSSTAYTTSSVGNALTLYNTNTTTGNYIGIDLIAEPTTGNAARAAINLISTGNGTGDLAFSNRNSTLAECFRVKANGNFLIGTTTDGGEKLQVAGDVKISKPSTYSQIIIDDNTASGSSYALISGFPNLGDFTIRERGVQNSLVINKTTGNTSVAGSIQTGAPTTGTSRPWKLGAREAATVVLDTTQYIEVEVAGTFYKLAIVTPA